MPSRGTSPLISPGGAGEVPPSSPERPVVWSTTSGPIVCGGTKVCERPTSKEEVGTA